MIEKYLSIQDVIAIGVLIGVAIKLIQFYYFDKKNKHRRKK
ncbi:unnamed protein product [marine sediment metagenome]|uniref:Uncharacterized protein n=1 Tax=marine sediment metagenome TaxID=412755 RepID=X1G2W4_9ZZZZ